MISVHWSFLFTTNPRNIDPSMNFQNSSTTGLSAKSNVELRPQYQYNANIFCHPSLSYLKGILILNFVNVNIVHYLSLKYSESCLLGTLVSQQPCEFSFPKTD